MNEGRVVSQTERKDEWAKKFTQKKFIFEHFADSG